MDNQYNNPGDIGQSDPNQPAADPNQGQPEPAAPPAEPVSEPVSGPAADQGPQPSAPYGSPDQTVSESSAPQEPQNDNGGVGGGTPAV